MGAAVAQLQDILRHLHGLAEHPIAVVVACALLAALVEQRLMRRRTPDFSGAWRGIDGPPPKIPPLPRSRDRV